MEEHTYKAPFLAFLPLVFLSILFFFLPNTTHAAVTTVVSGTVYYPDNAGNAGDVADGVGVELHNGDGSIFETETTDGSGNFAFTLEDNPLVGENMSVEVNAPNGYNAPLNDPFTFVYQSSDDERSIEFVLVSAPKITTVSIQDINGNDVFAQVTAMPLAGGNQVSVDDTGTFTMNTTGGSWIFSTDANLSDVTNISNPDAADDPGDRPNYPWVAPRSMAVSQFDFADDNTSETATYTATVVPSEHYITAKLLDADGAILTGGSFQADVRLSCYNDEYGNYTTKRKVNSSGVVAVYLLPGTCRLSASHPQLQNQHFLLADTVFTVPEEAGKTSLGTIQAVENTGMLSGSVKVLTKRSGAQALDDITVSATNLDRGEIFQATTDSVGAFTFTQLPDGEYALTVDEDGYYPEKTALGTISVAEPTVFGLTLRAVRLDATITGTLRVDGAPIEDSSAIVEATYDGEIYTAPVAADGTYSVELPTIGVDDATATLRVVTEVGEDLFKKDPVTVKIDRNDTVTKNINLSDAEGTVQGTLKDQSGDLLSGNQVGEYSTVTAIHKKTQSVEVAPVESDGSFSLDLAPGKWTLIPQLDPSVDGVIAPQSSDRVVTVKADQEKTAHIRLRDATATVAGSITDPSGDPVIGAPVTVSNLPQLQKNGDTVDPDRIVTTTATTDDSGAYDISVPAGTYTVTVGSTPDVDDFVEPEAGRVKVSANETKNFNGEYTEATADVSGSIFGTYTTAQVQFFAKDGGVETVAVENDTYSTSLDPGKWTMVVSGVNKTGTVMMESKTVSVTAGEQTVNAKVEPTDMTLPETTVTTGDVSDVLVVSNEDGATVVAPPYSLGLTGTVTLQISPVPTLTPTGKTTQVGLAYEVTATDEDGQAISELNAPVTVQLPVDTVLGTASAKESYVAYDNSDLESKLTDGMAAVVSKDENNQAESITLHTKHFTRFSVNTSGALTKKSKKPRKVRVKEVGEKMVRVLWKKPAKKKSVQSPVASYRIEIRKCKKETQKACKKGKNYTAEKKWRVLTGISKQKKRSVKKVVVRTLQADTYYQLRVAAKNAAGIGAYSKWITFLQ